MSAALRSCVGVMFIMVWEFGGIWSGGQAAGVESELNGSLEGYGVLVKHPRLLAG